MTRATPTLLLSVALAALSAAAVVPAYVNHDAAWYLYMVQRWIDGAVLYSGVIDTNPPVIVWLSWIPVRLAGLFGTDPPAIFKAYVFVVAALSLLAARRIVRRAWPASEFLLVSVAVFLALPFVKGDFGQREHFAVLLTLPYIVLAAAPDGVVSRPGRGIAGFCAGLGFAIKPHALLAWMAVEAAVARHRGLQALRRSETVAAVAAVVLYGVAVTFATPQYFGIADIVRRVYGGLDSDVSVLLRLREVQLWLAAAVVFAAARWPAGASLPLVLFAAGSGFLASALLQQKGWGYQLYPARVFILFSLAAAAGALLDLLPSALALLRGGRRGLGMVLAATLVVASIRYVAEARRPAAPDLVTPLVHAIETTAPDGPIAVLSMRTIIYPAFPAVNYAGTRWSLRHNSLWFLPAFYANQDRRSGGPLQPHLLDAMPELERRFFSEIVDDLCAQPPVLLAIEQAAPLAPAGRRALDLQAYYAQDSRMQHLFSGYQPAATIGPFTVLAAATAPTCR